MASHPLDRAIWEALSTRQRALGHGGDLARRFDPAVAPFAATADDTAPAFRALLDLLQPGERVALCTTAAFDAPQGFTVARRDLVDQMVLQRDLPAQATCGIVPLDPPDVPAMLALADATRPGPFGPRTIEAGPYLGVKVGGALVAMAGERMRLGGFGEISAVCVDPAQRGQGLAADLVRAVAAGIGARGDMPFLHVFASNEAAAALYRKLGFASRCRMHLTVLAKPRDV